MYIIESSFENGTFLIKEEFEIDVAPIFVNLYDEHIINFGPIQNVKFIDSFFYDTKGMSDGRFLLPFYRISTNNTEWSEWLDLKKNVDNFPIVDYLKPFYLEVKWVRNGFSEHGVIYLLEYYIEGKLDRNEKILNGIIPLEPGNEIIIRAPYVFKVFSLNGYEVILSPENISNIDIMFRYSQDNTRSWSRWEIFNEENISTLNISPTRFFQIEYLVKNNSISPIRIYDINLIGDFQNVTKDSIKTNLYGIRECCSSNILGGYIDENGNFIPNTNFNTTGLPPSCDANVFKPMTDQEKANLYNPYAQNTAINLWEKLSNDSLQMFGHQVTYFVTDPDRKGDDQILNEYQLFNIVCKDDIKVSVTDNKFPDSQIKMNMFDLDLFETMEVHITKQEFKSAFGKQRKPSKEDFLYFCNLNRMFQVDHAQQERTFNNAAVYYRLILKKYTQKSNVKPDNINIKNTLDQLTKNSTIDELFGVDIEKQKQSIANKDQHKPLTSDPIRLEYLVEIDRELVENSTTIISKSHYDLSSVKYGDDAVMYKNFNSLLKKSDNLSYITWFNLNNYIENENYNFGYNYDIENNLGWNLYLRNDIIHFDINNANYEFVLRPGNDVLSIWEDTWYSLLLNVDQRNKNIELYIYKRNVEDEDDASKLPNNILSNVYNFKQEMNESYQYDIENKLKLIGSDMRITNIRIFSDIIPEKVHSKVLNQYIIGDDAKFLIMADNSTEKLYQNLPRDF
jgi:hypothetical protein